MTSSTPSSSSSMSSLEARPSLSASSSQESETPSLSSSMSEPSSIPSARRRPCPRNRAGRQRPRRLRLRAPRPRTAVPPRRARSPRREPPRPRARRHTPFLEARRLQEKRGRRGESRSCAGEREQRQENAELEKLCEIEPHRRVPSLAACEKDATPHIGVPAGTCAFLPVRAPRSSMRILLWHGYLLGGTGSNVYTRSLARVEPCRARGDRVRQDPHPTASTSPGRASSGRSSPDRCPFSSSTATKDTTRSCSRTSRPRSVISTSTRTRSRFASTCLRISSSPTTS